MICLARLTGCIILKSSHYFPIVLAPWNVRLLKTTENSLAIGWDKIIDVDYYLISYFPVGEEALMKEIRVPKDQTNYEIRGLIPGTEYVITLRNVKKEVFSEPELLQGSTGRTLPFSFHYL